MERLAAALADRYRFGFLAHGGRFYFTVGDRQSDIWAAEVEAGKRP